MAANQLLLSAAARGNFEECVRLIDEDDADVNAANTNGSTPLHFVAAKGDMAMVQMLVDFGADVNARDKEDVGGYTPLHYAVQMNNYEVVELLLVNGANPNLADVKHGWACLHCAVRLKNNAIAKLLIAKGADVHQRDNMGSNASFWAREVGNDEYLAIEAVPEPATALAEEKVLHMKLKQHADAAIGVGGAKKKKGGKKKGGKKKKTKK